jgi:hypothetical protein
VFWRTFLSAGQWPINKIVVGHEAVGIVSVLTGRCVANSKPDWITISGLVHISFHIGHMSTNKSTRFHTGLWFEL